MLCDVSEDWPAVLSAPMGTVEEGELGAWSVGAVGVQRPLLQSTSHGLSPCSNTR